MKRLTLKQTGVGLTGWYPPEVKPVNAGEYETLFAIECLEDALLHAVDYLRAYSDGNTWYTTTEPHRRLWIQERYWRGLTERAT